MKKLILPIDGTKRSLQTATWVMNTYSTEEVEIVIVMVADSMDELRYQQEYNSAAQYMITTLKRNCGVLKEKGYQVSFEALFGDPGKEICDYAKENKADIIVMTKSTKENWFDTIGSVTTYVVKYAKCPVMIIPENK
ncbi:universal stress protein [Catenisphaera adipataccumulans]|jgi:nucleotide-binding universal stress UspA family protein|uniref:Nucleotide-binding universal stress UspA family protein n=1 Tax=Catenisphaera adipataccumulans TaxID=700500 RepID=A0A7W8FVF7_9FIRM|nr:universal stress protein [Catenisphaera adipataccumulans]MBB5183083.1 nucleotide-binding universal stress UspA family protein [Catenisphaera adipataccumulans]